MKKSINGKLWIFMVFLFFVFAHVTLVAAEVSGVEDTFDVDEKTSDIDREDEPAFFLTKDLAMAYQQESAQIADVIRHSPDESLFCMPVNDADRDREADFAVSAGGAGEDICYAIGQVMDGGYLVMGENRSFGAGNRDCLALKYDAAGTLLWARTQGGSGDEYPKDFMPTSDGGCIAVGITTTYGSGNYDFLLYKLDAAGNLDWAKTVGGGSNDLAISIEPTNDGGYLVGGTTASYGSGSYNFLMIKYDSLHNREWAMTTGDSNSEWCYVLKQTADGGYIAGGRRGASSWEYNFMIVKYDASLQKEWLKVIGAGGNDVCESLYQTAEGDFIAAGYTQGFGADYDVLIVKLAGADGSLLWAKTIGGADADQGAFVHPASDGGIIVGGRTMSLGAGHFDGFIIKLDDSGNLVWARTVGGSEEEQLLAMTVAGDGYVFGGSTKSYGAGDDDFLTVKTDGQGFINDCDFIADCSPDVIDVTSTIGFWDFNFFTYTHSPNEIDITSQIENLDADPFTVEICLDATTPTPFPTNTPTATHSPTLTPTGSPTLSPTLTPTHSPSITPTETPTLTPTLTPTDEPSSTPTITISPTPPPVPALSGAGFTLLISIFTLLAVFIRSRR